MRGKGDAADRLLLWVPFTVGILLTFRHSVDDSFITLRYARHLAGGSGLVYNPGEQVEGFSSPLHVLLTAALQWVDHDHVLLATKMTTIVFGVACAYLGGRLILAAELTPLLRRVGLIALGASYPLAMAAVNGLETSAFSAALAAVLLAVVTGWSSRHPWWTGGVAATAVLLRPEGFVAVAAIAVVCGFAPDAGRGRWERMRWAGVAAGAGAALLIVRLAYFGSLVPNTYVAKNPQLGPALRQGAGYLSHWIVPSPGDHLPPSPGDAVLLVLLAAVVGLFVAGTARLWRDRLWLSCPAVVGAVAIVVVEAGGDWMPGSRRLAPLVVPFLVTLLWGGTWMQERIAAAGRAPAWRYGAAAVVLTATLVPWTTEWWRPVWAGTRRFDDESLLVDSHIPRWGRLPELLRCAPEGSTVALEEIGYSGWERDDLRVLDLHGLTDERLASGARDDQRSINGVDPRRVDPTSIAVREVLRRRPTVVVLFGELERGEPLARYYRAVATRGGMVAHLRRDLTCDAT